MTAGLIVPGVRQLFRGKAPSVTRACIDKTMDARRRTELVPPSILSACAEVEGSHGR